MLEHLCPCCGRHCYLDHPHCERGAEYAKSGVIPPRTRKPDGERDGKKPSEHKKKRVQAVSLYPCFIMLVLVVFFLPFLLWYFRNSSECH